jgi:hypothetical protein
MARSAPDTATGSFSIVIGDQPRGMDVVKAIQASRTGQRGPYGTESLDPPIRILKAYRR